MTDRLYFRQLLSGRDFAAGDMIAAQMRNFAYLIGDRETGDAVVVDLHKWVQSDKDPASAGWLTWALANGWGGRKLTDDVVTAGLQAIFGPLLDPNNTTPALADDHVDANDVPFGSTFPYLAAAH